MLLDRFPNPRQSTFARLRQPRERGQGFEDDPGDSSPLAQVPQKLHTSCRNGTCHAGISDRTKSGFTANNRLCKRARFAPDYKFMSTKVFNQVLYVANVDFSRKCPCDIATLVQALAGA